jgi:hypothetical protein
MNKAERQLKKLFKRLDNKTAQPSNEWLASTRVGLQQHIKANPVSRVEHFVPDPLPRRSWLAQPIGVMASILIAVLVIGGGTTYVAKGAEPGDTLYPLKIVGENFSVFVNVSPEAKAKLYLKYADRRMEELEKLYEKEPANEYWQEKVVQNMSEQIVSAKNSMAQLEEKSAFTEVALDFESLTDEHDQRLQDIQARLNTTTAIIDRVQELNEINKQKAFEVLEEAEKMFEEKKQPKLKKNKQLKKKLESRLKLLKARQKRTQDQLNKKSDKDSIKVQFNGVEVELEEGSDDGSVKVYEVELEDGGLYFESEVEVESEGDEEVETIININDGQATIKSLIQATGTSIIIKESSNVVATSSQRIEVKGMRINWKEDFIGDFFRQFEDKFNYDRDDEKKDKKGKDNEQEEEDEDEDNED